MWQSAWLARGSSQASAETGLGKKLWKAVRQSRAFMFGLGMMYSPTGLRNGVCAKLLLQSGLVVGVIYLIHVFSNSKIHLFPAGHTVLWRWIYSCPCISDLNKCVSEFAGTPDKKFRIPSIVCISDTYELMSETERLLYVIHVHIMSCNGKMDFLVGKKKDFFVKK